ncbi:MAG TPA: AAA family ATPase [Blastococcus sp.]|nr:AAA family ATPase [Blastococcus sp.]
MTGVGYADDLEYLADELRRLDLLIRLRVAALAGGLYPETQLDRAVYVSHEEVQRLLAGEDASPEPTAGKPAALRSALAELGARIDRRVQRSAVDGVELALPRLGRLLRLSAFERQAVLICLAPELRRRYDRLYAYLQDDITRRRPSVDLVLELLCERERDRWRCQGFLADGAPLLRAGVLEPVADPSSPSGSTGLARFLRVDPHVVGHLLGDHQLDPRLDGRARLDEVTVADEPDVDPDLLDGVLGLLSSRVRSGRRCLLHLHGPDGSGTHHLARQLCARLGLAVLHVDVPVLLTDPRAAALLPLVFREALLRPCAVHLAGVEAVLTEPARPVLAALAAAIDEYGEVVVGSGRSPWPVDAHPALEPPISVAVPSPDRRVRTAVWRRALAARGLEPAWAEPLAARYRLTPERIHAAVASAITAHEMRRDGSAPTPDDLGAACRAQSSHSVADLASKIELRYGWDDLVLPESRLQLLHEICAQVRHHHRVYEDWGFGQRLRHGRGLSVLFSGPPGTGKTLAAQVMAADVGLDLYRVDLSGVVSKYIGETEKNLSRIFAEAEHSNAILFFDEADALFGKRSEVTDAHDRYANIETSYLLQRMEDYSGVVVLATNLQQNLDRAFARRIRFLVDFPFPDETQRRRIWETHFPPLAPVGSDVDCAFLAREFPVAGGNIKNIVLNAAFLAAADGGTITSRHLLDGTRREFDKAGKVWSEPRRP